MENILNEDVLDALSELGNVGLGMASTKMGHLLGERIELEMPQVFPVTDSLYEEMGIGQATDSIGLVMDFIDTLEGKVVFLLDKQFAYNVVQKMTGMECDMQILEDELGQSALMEFSNIIAGAYMKAIGNYTGLRIYMKPSRIYVKSAEDTVKQVLTELNPSCKKAVCIDTRFSVIKDEIETKSNVERIVMLPIMESAEKLVESLDL